MTTKLRDLSVFENLIKILELPNVVCCSTSNYSLGVKNGPALEGTSFTFTKWKLGKNVPALNHNAIVLMINIRENSQWIGRKIIKSTHKTNSRKAWIYGWWSPRFNWGDVETAINSIILKSFRENVDIKLIYFMTFWHGCKSPAGVAQWWWCRTRDMVVVRSIPIWGKLSFWHIFRLTPLQRHVRKVVWKEKLC